MGRLWGCGCWVASLRCRRRDGSAVFAAAASRAPCGAPRLPRRACPAAAQSATGCTHVPSTSFQHCHPRLLVQVRDFLQRVRSRRFPPIEQDMKMVLAHCGSLFLEPGALQEVRAGHVDGAGALRRSLPRAGSAALPVAARLAESCRRAPPSADQATGPGQPWAAAAGCYWGAGGRASVGLQGWPTPLRSGCLPAARAPRLGGQPAPTARTASSPSPLCRRCTTSWWCWRSCTPRPTSARGRRWRPSRAARCGCARARGRRWRPPCAARGPWLLCSVAGSEVVDGA